MINLGNRIVNNYIYPIDSGYVLIDTGYENGFSRFLAALSRNHLTINDISYIFLTHAHDDHAGFLNLILESNSRARVILSEKALERLYRGQNSFDGGCTSFVALFFCKVMSLFGKGEHKFPALKTVLEDRCMAELEQNLRYVQNMRLYPLKQKS